ncbi:MAG: hypothetical protein R2864_14685 [Syntrophotaleaceae bacterium]
MADIDLRARDIYSREKGRLQLSGRVAQQPNSHLQIAGKLALPTDLDRWRQARLI